MNPLYQMLMGGSPQQSPVQPQYGNQNGWSQQQVSSVPQFTNPVQKMNYILQAMRNPAAFVRQAIPDLPPAIANDPNQILNYLQQTRGVSAAQIQQLANQVPRF